MIGWLLALAAPSRAGASDAEAVRLRAEMEDLAARTSWKGVDTAYRQLDALKGAEPTYDDHVLGALAARQLGEVNDAWWRLKRAAALDGTEEVYTEIALLEAYYGPVDLVVSKHWRDPIALEALDPPFEAVPRAVIERARLTLDDAHRYQGLLPLGRYDLSGVAFEVIGGPEVKAKRR